MRSLKILSLSLLATLLASTASAGVITLDFENVAPYPSGNNVYVQDYYNGGTSSNGSAGTDYGISFSSNSLIICLNTLGVTCSNTSRGDLAPESNKGSLFFLQGSSSVMNVAAGFTDGFSFNYVSLSYSGNVDVYDGLDGTGNLLGTLNLSPNAGYCPGYNAGFCPYSPIGVNFAGIAKSVSFAGVANQIVFDDITFGSSIVGGGTKVPEPSPFILLGLALAGLVIRRLNK